MNTLNWLKQWISLSRSAQPLPVIDDVARIQIIPAEQITQKRIALKYTVLDLAELCCLTTTQVKALESGNTSPFYTEAIRQQCYKRVALTLGINPIVSQVANADSISGD
jgi:hypothetical protein